MNIQKPTMSDILLIKLDDNKYEGHEGTKWVCSGKTFIHLLHDRDRKYVFTRPDGRLKIMGLNYEINNSMNIGEIELIN